VERRIDRSNLDLDNVAALILDQQPGWRARGLSADPLTWVDNDASWPTRLLTDRGHVRRPLSPGVRVHGGDAEARIVVYTAGWYDAEYLTAGGDEVIDEHAELDDIEALAHHLGRIAACLADAG
jgi:hypothetical protein